MKSFGSTCLTILLVFGLAGCNKETSEEASAAAQPEALAPVASAPTDGNAAPSARPVSAPARTAAPAALRTVEVPAGSEMNVTLVDALSSETNKAGDPFKATLAEPIMVDGRIIVQKGAEVQGRVVDAERSGRVSGRASMRLALTSIVDGAKTYPLVTKPFVAEAEGSKGRDAGIIGGASGIGAAIGAIAGGKKGAGTGAIVGGAAGTGAVLATRGKEVEFGSESKLKFVLDQAASLPPIS